MQNAANAPNADGRDAAPEQTADNEKINGLPKNGCRKPGKRPGGRQKNQKRARAYESCSPENGASLSPCHLPAYA